MEATQIYAIAAGSIFVLLTVLNSLLCILQKLYACNMLLLRHLIYPFLIRRHRFVGPWTRLGVLLRLIYLIANIFLSIFPVLSLSEAAGRAGRLSLINMIPLFFGPHFSFLADVIGVPLHTYQSLHGASAAMTVLLGATHVVLGALHKSTYFRFAERPQVAGLIVSPYQ